MIKLCTAPSLIVVSIILDFDDINFGLPVDTPAYTPQTIKMMTRQTIGMGVRVEKDIDEQESQSLPDPLTFEMDLDIDEEEDSVLSRTVCILNVHSVVISIVSTAFSIFFTNCITKC